MAAGYTTVTGALLQDASGAKLALGVISFLPVTDKGVPTSFRAGGAGGQTFRRAVTVPVVNGAFTTQLADTTLTSPLDVAYRVSVQDLATGEFVLGAGYETFQPSGEAVNFDLVPPDLPAGQTKSLGPVGPQGPIGLTGAAGPQGPIGLTGAAGQPAPTADAYTQGLLTLPDFGSVAMLRPFALNALTTDTSEGVVFRGAQYGSGVVWTPTQTTTADVLSFPIDPSPTAAFVAAAPMLHAFAYDVTAGVYVFNNAYPFASWSGAIGSNLFVYPTDSAQTPFQFIAGHTYRLGLWTNTLGLGFYNATQLSFPATISNGGYSSVATQTDQSLWTSWAYSTGALTFSTYQRQAAQTAPPAALVGVRRYTGTPTDLGSDILTYTTARNGYFLQSGWAVTYTAAGQFNLVQLQPAGTPRAAPVRVAVLSSDRTMMLAYGDISAAEWNYYTAEKTPFTVPLNKAIAAGTYVIAFYDTAGNAGVDFAPVPASAEVPVAYLRVTPSTALPTSLPPLIVAYGDGINVPMVHAFYDAAGANAFSVIDPNASRNALGQPDILLPSVLYVLTGTPTAIQEANIYYANVVRGRYAQNGFITTTADRYISGGWPSANFWRLQAGNTSVPVYNVGVGSPFTLTLNALDASFHPVASASTLVTPVSLASTNAVRLHSIGDSQTNDGRFQSQIASNIGSVTLVGSRTMDGGTTYQDGRPGWWVTNPGTSNGYLNKGGAVGGGDSPFMWPTGITASNYWGNVQFWQNVISNSANYNYVGFQLAAKHWGASYVYDATTGYPINPPVGTVVTDPGLAAGHVFQMWNGSAWVDNATQPTTWYFSYANFIAQQRAFGNPSLAVDPTHATILFGGNDLQAVSNSAASLPEYLAGIATMITSIHAYNAAIKIVLGLPLPSATQDGWGLNLGSTSTRDIYVKNGQDAARALLAAYDSAAQRNANIYVAPTNAAIDPVYGWDTTTVYPGTSQPVYANKYTTGTTLTVDSNFVHPSGSGYAQVGDAFAAIIQATR